MASVDAIHDAWVGEAYRLPSEWNGSRERRALPFVALLEPLPAFPAGNANGKSFRTKPEACPDLLIFSAIPCFCASAAEAACKCTRTRIRRTIAHRLLRYTALLEILQAKPSS